MCAVTFLNYILCRRVQRLEQGSHLTYGIAWMIASRELFAPTSCVLLVTHSQIFQECCPIIKVEDCPRELGANTPALASKDTWSQKNSFVHDFAADWHGQDSGLGGRSFLYSKGRNSIYLKTCGPVLA